MGLKMRRRSESDRSYIKIIIAVIVAILGTALVFFKAFTPDTIMHYIWIGVGLVLIFGYSFFSWSWFEDYFGKDASVALFLPPLVTFGVLLIVVSATDPWINPPHDMVMIVLGAALIVIPIFFLRKFIMRKL